MFRTIRGCSRHARERQQHRAVSEEQQRLVVKHGRKIRQPGGRVAYFVGYAEAVRDPDAPAELLDCLNTAVVLADDQTVVTVIRTNDVRRLRRWGRR